MVHFYLDHIYHGNKLGHISWLSKSNCTDTTASDKKLFNIALPLQKKNAFILRGRLKTTEFGSYLILNFCTVLILAAIELFVY